ncbi:unnamed protein product [Mytilus coruscus]|uniref:Novel STAND NTPase 3 domain-containing protein n=1 Tax=Mytilus coruscus TaxID=42192 RepID=A0A6J8DBR0_MYTCO|nr:unnamed protein product [Mytilus coruscus]
MTSIERENFLRHAILVVDHSKSALVSLVELNVANKSQTFEQFVNTNQHEIYHLYNSSRCCQCPTAHYPLRSPHILYQSQMELLFDRSSKLPCHNTARRSAEFCCSMAKSGLYTDVLDLTLARCLLVNLCNDIFWFSCLQFQSMTFEDFLNNNKHELYHLWQYNAPCCQCPPGYTFPTNYSVLGQNDWMQMFNAVLLPCADHKKRPSPGSMQSICSVAAKPGITSIHLNPSLRRIILQHCCTLRMAVETLVQIRNQDYGHAKEGLMSVNEYNTSVVKIERCIIDIAKVCKKETQFKQKIREAKDGALDQTLFTQYHNNLMETLTRQAEIHKSVADIAPCLNKISNKIEEKAGQIPKLMDECVRKGYDYQEQLMERLNQTLVKVKNQTHMEIDCHVEEQTFVETNAVRKCKEWMDKKDVFVIIGKEGSGKSRNGLEILRQFGLTDEDFDLLKVTNIKQVKDIITDKRKTVVLIDDVFSSKEYPYNNLNNCHILDLLNARKYKGNMKIIFTVDSSKMNSFNYLLVSHRLFQNCCKIDLSSSRFCMSEDEKANLLFNFCKKHEIRITWNSYDGDEEFNLDGRTVYEIAKTDPFIGYPQSCFMFTSNKSFLQLGIHFFKHPDQYLIAEINSFRDSTNTNLEKNISYALLVYTLLNTGYLDINEIDISKLETIMESCGNCKRRRLFNSKVKKMAEQMDGRFLKQDTQTMVYHFKHPMIYEALAISYYEVNPSEVISVLNFDFIIDLIKLEFEDFGKQEISLIIAKEMFGYLTKRLFTLFEKNYIMRSAEFIKTLCGSSIILQNNPDFIGLLIKEFNNCTSQDTISIRIEGRRDQMSFHFPRALLWSLIQKQNVDKHIATVLHFIENDIKDEQNLEKVKACKKVIVACFYYLCETDNSDMKLELIYGLIKEYGIECNYDFSIQIALKDGNDPAVIFLLSHESKEIDIVDLVFEVEHEEDIRRLCDLLSANLSIECIDTYNKTDILKILFRSLPLNLFNLRKSIKTACIRLCKDLVTEILIDARPLTFDTGNIVNTACANGWQDALKILLNKKLCNQNEKRQIFTASCKDGMETFLKWMLFTVDTAVLDVQEFLLEDFSCENFEAVKNFIWKLKDYHEMETMIKKVFTQFSLTVFRFIQWIIADTDNQIDTVSKSELQNLNILRLIYERFPDLQIDLKSTALKTINDKISNFDEILQWVHENIKTMFHPITSLLNFSCRNDLKKIIKWILHNYNHSIFNIHELIIETCKARSYKTAEVIISEVDLNKVDVTSIITAMLSTYQNNSSKDMFLFLIHNIDNKYYRWVDIIKVMVNLELYSFIELILQHADYSKIDMEEAMNYACFMGKLDTVKWLLKKIDNELFDMTKALITARNDEEFHIVNWLIKNIDNKLFDMKEAMSIACRMGKLDTVKWLTKNIDNTLFDMMEAMNNACGSENLDIVKWLIENFDNELFDLKEAMSNACLISNLDTVKWLTENFDNELFDMKEAMNNASRKGKLDTVKWLIENFNIKLFDLKEAIKNACIMGKLDIVKWLIQNFDNELFDMKEAMNNACLMGKLDTVEWLIENFDNIFFDMKEAMNNACWSGDLDIVKWLIENFDNELFDIKEE